MLTSSTTFCLSRLALPLILLFLRIAASEASEVIGVVDNVVAVGFDEDPYIIRGWTCQQGDSRSTSVHIYLEKKASKSGTFLKAVVANKPSDKGVGKTCGTEGMNYRFEVPISNAEALGYVGEKIYAYGISTIGTGNPILNEGRGEFRVPKGVIGEITDVKFSNAGGVETVFIGGWTCQPDNKDQLALHFFMGGTATGGGKNATLNMDRERKRDSPANEVCKGSNVEYDFYAFLGESEIREFKGDSIYAYAWSTGDQAAPILLGRSGEFTVP